MKNRCYNCKYFMTCKKSDPNVKDCKWFSETIVKEIKQINEFKQTYSIVKG